MFNYNKAFTEDLQHTIDLCLNNNDSSTLILIELTNCTKFKILYGLKFTETLVKKITQGIETILPPQSKIYNIDYEYIGIILKDYPIDLINDLAGKIYHLLQMFRSFDNINPVQVTATISSVNLPFDSRNAEDALEKAYITSKNSKFDENRYYFPYTDLEESKKNYKNKFILAESLKSALLDKRLRLAFQPIIRSNTGLISHYECLLRIINEEGKIISAGPFIPIAEEMGFINLVDELVLEMVIEELKASPNITLTFNLSALGVYNNSWLLKSKKLLKEPLLSSRLIVEITETAAHKDLGKAAYFVATLQDMGCQVALDDFGSGHTSFRQLKALPVDLIKIDGAFIRDIADNNESLLFVKTLITMCKGIGFRSVAEFVENGEIAKLLLELDIDYMQGNYFCPAVNYRSWLSES